MILTNVDKPDINFIGLIIGPRGVNQKELEKDTGARISIRGKDSKKMSKLSKNSDDEDDDCHVLIIADNQDSLNRAVERIESIINADDLKIKTLKQAQLKELAIRNGTLREDRVFEIDKPIETGLKCIYCGSTTHASCDCPERKQKEQEKMDEVEKAFDEFMDKIKDFID